MLRRELLQLRTVAHHIEVFKNSRPSQMLWRTNPSLITFYHQLASIIKYNLGSEREFIDDMRIFFD